MRPESKWLRIGSVRVFDEVEPSKAQVVKVVEEASEVFEVAEWHYCQYKEPYTGAPVYVWYIDNEGREVKRPYEG